MTPAEAQATLTVLHGHLDGKTGNIESYSIFENGTAKVIIDYATFIEVFPNQSVPTFGNTVRKEVGETGITYVANLPNDGTHDTTP